MNGTVFFRDFEERDIDFIYRCKNDEKLNSMIIGQFKPFSMEDAERWVRGCMGEHDTYKFWAICTNDEEKQIIGWLSLSNIDYISSKACFHGLVIGVPAYNDGLAWIESYLFVMEQAFDVLHLNRLYGTHITEHKTSAFSIDLFGWTLEGIERQSLKKNGRYYDVNCISILNEEYQSQKTQGLYSFQSIIRRLRKLKKNK